MNAIWICQDVIKIGINGNPYIILYFVSVWRDDIKFR